MPIPRVYRAFFTLHSALCILHFLMAGREGLEPPTDGFGDRYSTN